MVDNTTILVVDDEPFNLEIIEDLLADLGYKLILVESGTEAWDVLEKSPDCCQVILLDRMLPDIDGLDLLKKIKKIELSLMARTIELERSNQELEEFVYVASIFRNCLVY